MLSLIKDQVADLGVHMVLILHADTRTLPRVNIVTLLGQEELGGLKGERAGQMSLSPYFLLPSYLILAEFWL